MVYFPYRKIKLTMNKYQNKFLIISVIVFIALTFVFFCCFQKFIPEVSQEKDEQFPGKAEDLTSEDIVRLARYIKKDVSEIANVPLSQEEMNLLVEQEIVNGEEAEELRAIEHLLNKGNVD